MGEEVGEEEGGEEGGDGRPQGDHQGGAEGGVEEDPGILPTSSRGGVGLRPRRRRPPWSLGGARRLAPGAGDSQGGLRYNTRTSKYFGIAPKVLGK